MTRKEARKQLIEFIGTFECPSVEAVETAIEALSERIGEWIFEETDEYKRTYCSVCGAAAPFVCVFDDYYGRKSHGEVRKTKFCPNCGADMRR